jgi:phospholipase/carboxylesterase
LIRAGLVAALLLLAAPAAADPRRGELSARIVAAAAAGQEAGGLRRLDGGALLYVPSSYRHGRPTPLLVLLHGAGRRAPEAIALGRGEAERLGVLLLAPRSHGSTWDRVGGRYGPDVERLDAMLRRLTARYSLDPERLAIGGFSDGASYALSLASPTAPFSPT